MRHLVSSVLLAGLCGGCAALLGLGDEDGNDAVDDGGPGRSSSGALGSSTGGTGASSGPGLADSGGASSGTTDQDGAPSTVEANIGAGEWALSAGAGHTCVITEAATVKCWGRAIIVGRPEDTFQPVDVPGLDRVQALASGDDFVCALRADRSVWCWGVSGLPVLGGPGSPASPHSIGAPPGVLSIAAGRAHACLIAKPVVGLDKVWCWGLGGNGRLGLGNNDPAFAPKLVTTLGTTEPTAVAAGAEFTCSAHGASVQCWGRGDRWQLANSAETTHTSPVEATIGIESVGIAAGRDYACVRGALGVARCWGDNTESQLGLSSAEGKLEPTQPDPVDLAAVRAGDRHTCFRHTAGEVECWGLDVDGRTGPTPLPGTYDLVAAGTDHTCVARRPSTIECFGANGSGQLGRSGAGGSTPQRVAGF